MLRKTFSAIGNVLAVAATSQAGSSYLQAATPTAVGNGLTCCIPCTLRVILLLETINGIQDPSITAALGGSGLHQVWTPHYVGAHSYTCSPSTRWRSLERHLVALR